MTTRIKKPAIPAISVADRRLETVLNPIKQNIELITGVRGGRLEPLSDGATLQDVIAKVNVIIERLNQ